MKKIIALILIMCVFGLTSCGNVSNVTIKEYSSEIYTDTEINDAINEMLNYFKFNFKGCTLKELSYIGDDRLAEFQEFADMNNADDVIVFLSTFDVDSSGGDGSLNPNDTYVNYNWILTRNDGGNWKHFDHGY